MEILMTFVQFQATEKLTHYHNLSDGEKDWATID